MKKKYIVRLTDLERATLEEVVKKLQGTSQKVRRAQVLLKADANGPGWTDQQIAEAYSCRIKMSVITIIDSGLFTVIDGPAFDAGRDLPRLLILGRCSGLSRLPFGVSLLASSSLAGLDRPCAPPPGEEAGGGGKKAGAFGVFVVTSSGFSGVLGESRAAGRLGAGRLRWQTICAGRP